ncbi:hypothetical protein QBC41DRAFT_227131 [Cercophora samala]|uniref:Uncharacterized protein n=1 Tax=Cercophora samala TaxID=330535 RepID=A0AA39ZBY7_9PEZI|nr:hypothetical protein QBC41DRAFT_227131 [Cercophora samala]
MELFPDLGAWLLRSVRRDTFAESPILAIQRLKLLPQPIGDSDKDVLVGAVLNLGSSLSQALYILLELLPEDKAGERLGEILCPTLGQLLASLQTTLSAFECQTPTRQVSMRGGRLKHSRSESALRSAASLPKLAPRPLTPILMKRTPPETPKTPRPREIVTNTRVASSPLRFTTTAANQSRSRHHRKDTEVFPRLLREDITAPHQQHEQSGRPPTPPASHRPETSGLQNALKSELRVQAAIRVAVDSLEFAESQLQLVREINHLHGGSFDLMQKNFYTGYNNLLLRALELEQLESERPLSRPASSAQSGQNGDGSRASHQRQQASIHVSFPANMPTPPYNASSPLRAGVPRGNGAIPARMPTSDSEGEVGSRQGLARRNTIQGIRQENDQDFARSAIKRRLSLAEELALAGNDSDSDYGHSGSENGDESATDMAGERTDEASEEEASQQSESQADSEDDDDHYDSDHHGGGGGESSSSSNEFAMGEHDGRKDPTIKYS